MDGILNINKPAGWTSHDVVQGIRRITGESRIGHTGTLDPLATGVLLLCLGKATRIAQYLSSLKKTYVAKIRLGLTTDTGDIEGRVLERRAVRVREQDIRARLPRFIGEIQQIPPMYSAVKHGGIRLYQLARAGRVVKRAPRTVFIHGIEMLHLRGTELTLHIRCSKGTYVRSLAVDIGTELECGAHIFGLRREAVGDFNLDDSLEIADVERLYLSDCLSRYLLSMNEALHHLPEIQIGKENQPRIEHGTTVLLRDFRLSEHLRTTSEPVRLIGEENRLLGLGRIEMDPTQSTLSVQPIRVFV